MKSSIIPIHRGMHIVAELREEVRSDGRRARHPGTPTDVYIGVSDSEGREQIAFVEVGPDLIVVRAMRDALTELLGE